MPRVPVSASRLRHRATIEAPTVARDAATGAEVITWAEVATVRVELIESATGNDENLRDGVASYARPSRVRMWFRTDMTTDRRLNLGAGRLLQITGVAELGYRQGLELACKEWAHE
jgi:head-tail adaptor